MSTLADLHRSVKATVAGKHIGRLVFVRCLLQGNAKADSVPARLAAAASVVQDWFGARAEQVYAIGSAANGQASLSLQFPDGGTAFISYLRSPAPGSVDLIVLGNHGAIYHEATSETLQEEAPLAEAGLVALIERALKSGKPEPVGAKP